MFESRRVNSDGTIVSCTGKTEAEAAEALECYLTIIEHGHDASMAYCGASIDELREGAASPEECKAFVERWLRDTNQISKRSTWR